MIGSIAMPILDGDEFKELWEEHLSKVDRRKVRRAVRHGEALENPEWASIAVSLARRYQRFGAVETIAGTLLFAASVLLAAWTMRNLELSRQNWLAFLPLTWVVFIPAKLIFWFSFQRPRFKRSEQKNMLLLAGATSD